MKKALIIGHTFPEPSTTAAGSRMMQILDLLGEKDYKITFASTASISEKTVDLQSRNISVQNILLNDASFDGFIRKLDPSLVLFDRYVTEEQFGWRVTENCPNALKILDTEDLHFLRKAREEAVKNNKSILEANLFSETAKRELASILRCDLSLIISEFEMELLQNTFKIASEILYYLPFLVKNSVNKKNIPSFENREHFMAIGNLLHAPNVDSVMRLKQVWPKIRRHLPHTELHIYGAYAPQKILQLNNKKEGFIIKGWADDVTDVMKKYRVQLAPLRFGAGLKGKLFDSMQNGLPFVTTPIGAEGMYSDNTFQGSLCHSEEEFIAASLTLYRDESLWKEAQNNGFEMLEKYFQKTDFSNEFNKKINFLSANLDNHRQANFYGQILQHHTLQATKYLSKWIESKNATLGENTSPVCYENSNEVRDEYKFDQ